MKKFDGLLLCSDWDGTFCSGSLIPKVNIDAVRYFQENGGRFTIASGRFPSYLDPFLSDFRLNAPLIALNGALIYDMETKKPLFEGFLTPDAFLLAEKIIKKRIPYNDVTVYHSLAEGGQTQTFLPDDFLNEIPMLSKEKIYKILLKTDTEEKAVIGRKYAESLGFSEYDTVRSWNISLEILKKSNNKSAATLFLKKHLQADTLICIGDYENDVSMLRTADVSYAVKNAVNSVKCACTHTTVDVADGAVADVIFHL